MTTAVGDMFYKFNELDPALGVKVRHSFQRRSHATPPLLHTQLHNISRVALTLTRRMKRTTQPSSLTHTSLWPRQRMTATRCRCRCMTRRRGACSVSLLCLPQPQQRAQTNRQSVLAHTLLTLLLLFVAVATSASRPHAAGLSAVRRVDGLPTFGCSRCHHRRPGGSSGQLCRSWYIQPCYRDLGPGCAGHDGACRRSGRRGQECVTPAHSWLPRIQ